MLAAAALNDDHDLYGEEHQKEHEKEQRMAQLSYPSATEVQLRLGSQEDAILTVVRRWSWWTRADVEGRVPGESQVTAVILTAARSEDRMIRDILHRSFQMVFPAEGGEGVATALAPKPRARRPYR